MRPPTDAADVLDDVWLRRLHKRTFGDVWTWTGAYDAPSARTFELAGPRFHHRLVAIHPFPTGKGRHTRVATEYLVAAPNAPTPTCGAGAAHPVGRLRRSYLDALRAADHNRDDLEQRTASMWS